MCIWTNTGDIYSTECGKSFPVDGYRGEYCRSCSTLITERRQGITPGPWGVAFINHHNPGWFVQDADENFVAKMLGNNDAADARAIAKLPEIIESGRSWLGCRNGFSSTADAAATRFRQILDEAEGVQ